MTRFFLALLLAISLAGASGPAFAGPSHDCPMTSMPSGVADHEKMGCCTPDCAVACVPAVLGAAAIDLPAVELCVARPMPSRTNALPSVGPAATDPPPRTTFS